MVSLSENLKTNLRLVLSGLKQVKNLSLSSLRKVFSLMSRREKIALLVLAAAALANLYWLGDNFYLNHTNPAPTFGGSYTEGLIGQPAYINPILARQETDNALVKLVFSGLYKHGGNGELIPDLADGMPVISDDQKQYTIALKQNVKWHNNKPLTADDVVFTIQTLKDPNFKSPLRTMWMSTTVEKIDDFHVKFTTKNISGPFVNNLVLPILPKAVWSKADASIFLLSKSNLEAIGSGPYAIKEVKKMPNGKINEISLNSFDNYYNPRAKIETIIIKFYDSREDLLNALHSKEIQGLGFMPQTNNLYVDQERTDVQILKLPLPQYQVVFFNLNSKLLSDQALREALGASIDRKKIITDILKNEALLPASPFLPDPNFILDSKGDLNAAAAKLDAAGWKIDPKTNLRTKKTAVLELKFLTNDSLADSQVAAYLAEQWRALNIKVNLSILSNAELTENYIRPRNFDVLLFPQKFGADPDLFAFWHSSQAKDPGLNLTSFSDPEVDKLISEARNSTNLDERSQKYAQLAKLIAAKYAAVFLNQNIYFYSYSSSIKNVGLKTLLEPSDRFYDLPNWYIQEKRVWK